MSVLLFLLHIRAKCGKPIVHTETPADLGSLPVLLQVKRLASSMIASGSWCPTMSDVFCSLRGRLPAPHDAAAS